MKGKRLTLTLSAGLYEALLLEARREARGIASLAAFLLEKAIKDEGIKTEG